MGSFFFCVRNYAVSHKTILPFFPPHFFSRKYDRLPPDSLDLKLVTIERWMMIRVSETWFLVWFRYFRHAGSQSPLFQLPCLLRPGFRVDLSRTSGHVQCLLIMTSPVRHHLFTREATDVMNLGEWLYYDWLGFENNGRTIIQTSVAIKNTTTQAKG